MQIVKKTKDEGNVIVGYKCDSCEKLNTDDSLPEDWFTSFEGYHYCEDCKDEVVEYWREKYFKLVKNLEKFIEKYENPA